MSYSISYKDDCVPFSTLEGKTLTRVKNNDNDTIFFETDEGRHYVMGHSQDCCESVSVEEIHGDLEDLIGTPILIAEETSNSDNPPPESEWGSPESFTWTFYKLATVRGHVTIRWLGTSNGYYSESVDLYEKNAAKDDD